MVRGDAGQVYKAERPGWPLRVYHLRYEESLESDKFNAGLARERHVFEELIRSKAHMACSPSPPPLLSSSHPSILLTSQLARDW